MSETLQTSPATTSNGYEIVHPREQMDSVEFKEMVGQYGIRGERPEDRIEELKQLEPTEIAYILSDINRRAQGSEETLINQRVTKIGDKQTIAPENRYDVFMGLIDSIKTADPNTNPSRVGDVLALGTVLLHPFADGNGRTARMIGLLFNESFNADDYVEDFTMLAKSRDELRSAGKFMVNGYTPYFPDGFDQSDPNQVLGYLSNLLVEDMPNSYTGPYGQAQLNVPTANQEVAS